MFNLIDKGTHVGAAMLLEEGLSACLAEEMTLKAREVDRPPLRILATDERTRFLDTKEKRRSWNKQRDRRLGRKGTGRGP